MGGRMICPECGREYEAGASFCSVDGSKLQPVAEPGVGVCENCGREFSEPYEYCPDDGGRIIRGQAGRSHGEPSAAAGGTSFTVQTRWRSTRPASSVSIARWQAQPGIGQVLSRAWTLFKADFLKYIGIALLAVIPALIPSFEPIWNLLLLLVPLPEGIMMSYALKRAQGQEPRAGDLEPVLSKLWPLILVRVVGLILTTIGFILLVIPGIYLTVAYVLALALVLDRGFNFWKALETSRKVVSQRWFFVFGLTLITVVLMIIAILTVVGSVLALPFYCCVVIALYEAAVGIAGGTAKAQGS